MTTIDKINIQGLPIGCICSSEMASITVDINGVFTCSICNRKWGHEIEKDSVWIKLESYLDLNSDRWKSEGETLEEFYRRSQLTNSRREYLERLG
jgi:hypothetical protein